MSTSLLYHAFGLKNYDYIRTEYSGGDILFHIKPRKRLLVCPECRSCEVIKYGHFERKIRTVPVGLKPVFLLIEVPRVRCLKCGAVRRIALNIADPRRWYTRSFERLVLTLSKAMTMLDVARLLGIGWDCVKDIVKRHLVRRFEKPQLSKLKYIAIDEISVRKGHKYMTVVMDLESGAVVFVGDGKKAESLKPFWKMLRRSRAKIQAVSMDMSPTYIGASLEHLPKVPIVFDHFHVVKLLNEGLTELRQWLYRNLKDIFQRKVLKGARWILLKRPENLSDKHNEKQRLQDALAINEPLQIAYYMKEDLRQIWSQPDKKTATTVLDDWIRTAQNTGIAILISMAKTLAAHRYGILNWYDHPISSGPLEGMNNKIKTLKRQAYGFRDMEFFKLKIMALHETKYALIG